MSSQNSRNRARRKDPFRRALRAPAKRVAPNLCPLGQCEHADMLHDVIAVLSAERGRVACSVCDCKEGQCPTP